MLRPFLVIFLGHFIDMSDDVFADLFSVLSFSSSLPAVRRPMKIIKIHRVLLYKLQMTDFRGERVALDRRPPMFREKSPLSEKVSFWDLQSLLLRSFFGTKRDLKWT